LPLIDDDADDCEFFEIALGQTGIDYQLTIINNAIVAREQLEEGLIDPDFIFLDLNMPLVSGKELLGILREYEDYQNTKIIMYSTSSYYRDFDESKELGADHFLTKTPNLDKLSVLLENVISKGGNTFVVK